MVDTYMYTVDCAKVVNFDLGFELSQVIYEGLSSKRPTLCDIYNKITCNYQWFTLPSLAAVSDLHLLFCIVEHESYIHVHSLKF